jgi:5-methylcytosine-specific restriction endonuclease McrA
MICLHIIPLKEACRLGMTRYFTSIPCKHGHVSERKVSDRGCVRCRKDIGHRHDKKYPEKKKQRRKDYYNSNREREIMEVKEYYKNNRERFFTKEAKERRRKSFARYYIEHKEYYHMKSKEYLLKKARAMPRNLSEFDKWAIYEIYHFRKIKSVITGVDHHVDHIIPIRSDVVCGLHVPWNLRVIPAKENLSKSNKLIQPDGGEIYA